MKSTTTPPVCPDSEIIDLIELKQAPVHCNVLWSTRESAIAAPRGDIRLAYLPACGHTFNRAFDPSLMEYTQEYENSLHFSPRFQSYATELAERLIRKYELTGKDIVEIGAGKGDFLIMLCDREQNRGWGYDPSYVPGAELSSPNVSFVQDFYTEKYTSQEADLIVCRHVLEHIEDPDAFIAQVRRAVGDKQSVVFFEVPNANWTLRHGGIWDIIYEHCSYFSPHSLAALFRRHDFKIEAVKEVFGGQFLTIEAVPGKQTEFADDSAALTQLTAAASGFAANFLAKRDHWLKRLDTLRDAGKRGVVWGSGSKGVTFLNVMESGDEIAAVVDINTRKQGKYVAGTGHSIMSPSQLSELRPDFVIIMNANYREEIGRMLAEVGVQAEVMVA